MNKIPLSLGLCFVVAGPLFAQGDDDHTPPAVVLSMSVTQWNAYYAKHQGSEETELTERESLSIYGDDLRTRNRMSLRRLPAGRAVRLRRYEDVIGPLHTDALGLSSDNNGGGTIYEEIYASATVDDEQLIWVRINSPAPPLTAAEGVAVRANLAALRQALRRVRPTQFSKPGQFSIDVATFRHDESQLRTLITSDTTHDALAVSRYAVKEIIPDMSPTYP